MRQKHSYNYFPFNESYLTESKIPSVVLLPHEAKEKFIILHGRVRTGSD